MQHTNFQHQKLLNVPLVTSIHISIDTRYSVVPASGDQNWPPAAGDSVLVGMHYLLTLILSLWFIHFSFSFDMALFGKWLCCLVLYWSFCFVLGFFVWLFCLFVLVTTQDAIFILSKTRSSSTLFLSLLTSRAMC